MSMRLTCRGHGWRRCWRSTGCVRQAKARRIWIFDRGVVREENLAAIRKRGGQYLGRHAAQPDGAVCTRAVARRLDAGATGCGSEESADSAGRGNLYSVPYLRSTIRRIVSIVETSARLPSKVS